jgi:hypothetical protein
MVYDWNPFWWDVEHENAYAVLASADNGGRVEGSNCSRACKEWSLDELEVFASDLLLLTWSPSAAAAVALAADSDDEKKKKKIY